MKPETTESAWRVQGVAVLKATRAFAREHRLRSWWHLASTLAALAVLFTLLAFSLPWVVRTVLSLVTGLALVRMFVIYHDYLHGTILRKSRVAKVLMTIFGTLILSPASSWKRSHNHHHKNNSKTWGASIGSFPIMSTQSYARASWGERLRYRMERHPLTILLGYLTVFLWGMSLRPLLAKPRHHLDCAVAITVQAGLVVLLALWAPKVLLFMLLIPLAFASAFGAFLFYSQHNFPGVKFQARQDWNFVYAAMRSSSYTAMGPILRWFTGNIGYHHVHHMNAHIPFYRLPEAMAAIRELQTPTKISLSPWGIIQCLRLNLWDEETNETISFREGSRRQRARLWAKGGVIQDAPRTAGVAVGSQDTRPEMSPLEGPEALLVHSKASMEGGGGEKPQY
jgi:omega-6 fatty acid desaturase (delta-12 desaturase)